MRRTLQLILATAAASALAASAAASTQATFLGVNSGHANQSCTGDVGPVSGTGVIHSEATCTFAPVGTGTGVAIAAPGHLAGDAQASSHNGDSLVAGMGSTMRFDDFITFTSTTPGATTTSIAADVHLDGVLEGGVNGQGGFRVLVSFGGADFDLRQTVSQNGACCDFNSGWVFESGQLGAVTDLQMRTGFVSVPLNSPVHFLMLMELGASASGPGATGRSDFGLHSFHFGATPFLLDDGVTVSAGDYIVNNHYIDPLAPDDGGGGVVGGIPEPSEWGLLLAGFGLAGAMLRSRKRVVTKA